MHRTLRHRPGTILDSPTPGVRIRAVAPDAAGVAFAMECHCGVWTFHRTTEEAREAAKQHRECIAQKS